MDQSLDDIIKTRKFRGGVSKKFTPNRANLELKTRLNKVPFKPSINRVTDARVKIIQRNRAKIRDARDKIAEVTRFTGDARKKLLQNKRLTTEVLRNGGAQLRTAPILRKVHMKAAVAPYRPPPRRIEPMKSRLPDLISVPRGYVDYDNMERMEEEEYALATQLSRTVTNDIAHYGPSRGDNPMMGRRPSYSEPMDPFDVYDAPPTRIERHMSPDLLPPPPKGILRPSSRHSPPMELYQRRYVPEPTTHLSYEMRSRLERAPDPHASMGIFGKHPSSSSQSSLQGYRIVVSNLHNSVSQGDIKELFEDIGELYDSRLVRPGVAEVVYKRLEDAEVAVDTYHNRQLDGQPMKCLLVNPRSSDKPTAPAIKLSSSSTRHNSGKTPLEIDIDALHKVLFRR